MHTLPLPISALVLVGTFAVLPRTAAAQSNVPSPRVSVGAGAGLAIPLHGDFDFTPWAWDADVRLKMGPHGLLEAAAGEWRHSATTVTENIATTGGAIGRLQQTTSRTQRFVQANVLATGSHGRVRLAGGGGVGLLQHQRRTRTDATACSGAAPCGSFSSMFSNATGTVQAVGGADVSLSHAVALYAQARFLVPMTDPGGSDLRLTTGLRIGFGG